MEAGKKKLTAKQKKFCEEYMVDLNATQAAIRAGYKKANAKQTACENLAKPYLAEYISELKKKVSEKAEVDAEYITNGFKKVAENDNSTGGEIVQALKNLGMRIGYYEKDNSQRNQQTVIIIPGLDEEE